jgi:hypothetical protein
MLAAPQPAPIPTPQAVVCICGIIAGGRIFIRPLYKKISNLANAEIFAATTLLVVLGTSMATQLAGLSLALGAFLAGLLIAETEFALQVGGWEAWKAGREIHARGAKPRGAGSHAWPAAPRGAAPGCAPGGLRTPHPLHTPSHHPPSSHRPPPLTHATPG